MQARSFRRILALLLIMSASALVAAGVYKWVDESGVVHYSDTPPASQRGARQIAMPPALPGAADAAQQRLRQQLDGRKKGEEVRSPMGEDAHNRQAQGAPQGSQRK